MLAGSGSYDLDVFDAIVSWEWDFENDGTYDASGESVTHPYDVADVYTVGLRVTDTFGATDTATTTVTVSGEDITEFSTIALPVASILGLLFLFNHRKRRKED
jgi:PKD repeat protein